MKFCMVSSFFGSESFGGDSVYVERLSTALLRRGHQVELIYTPGAFASIRRGVAPRKYNPPDGLVLHPLNHGLSGILDAVWSHQTCRSGRLLTDIRKIFREGSFDVIHFHNISLMGAKDLLPLASSIPGPAVVSTLHDYWWLCPQSLFWKFGNRLCDSPECHRCNLARGVPPQMWRTKRWFNYFLAKSDCLLFPSRFAAETYQAHGLTHPRIMILPGLIPQEWEIREKGVVVESRELINREYIVTAGRLVNEKGFQDLIPLMKEFPQVDLMVAGDGPLRRDLEILSRKLDNIFFLGNISQEKMKLLLSRAKAVIVPSCFPETFGLAAAEALSLGVPLVARKIGALTELVEASGKGCLFSDARELKEIVFEIISEKDRTRPKNIVFGREIPDIWLESGHLDRYLEIIRVLSKSGLENSR